MNNQPASVKSRLTQDEYDSLLRGALEVRQQSYSPYSKFPVGAALLTSTGEIITGCNVENASYGLTICAERVACAAAVAKGYRRFKALALATDSGQTPCGACRQFLAEFEPSLPILLIAALPETRLRETSLETLLPGRFEL